MNNDTNGGNGLKLLVKTYREKFRIPENLNHYSDEDLKKAEKKYIKFVLGRYE